MSHNWCAHDGATVLLVEGDNDCHVVLALCKKLGVPHVFGIYQCGNDDRAIRRMNALIASSTPPDIVGLVVDADKPDLNGRWQQIVSKLRGYDYAFPAEPDLDGTVVESPSGGPRLGFWLMPNNQSAGMLEDFCTEMISGDVLTVIQDCVSTAEANGATTFREVHRTKAVVHSYLALQDEPGRPLGQAITANVLRADTPTTQRFVSWIGRLFDGAPALIVAE